MEPTYYLIDLGCVFTANTSSFAEMLSKIPKDRQYTMEHLDAILAKNSSKLDMDITGAAVHELLSELTSASALPRALDAYRGMVEIRKNMLQVLMNLRERKTPVIFHSDIDSVLLAHIRSVLKTFQFDIDIIASCELSSLKREAKFWRHASIEVAPKSKAVIFDDNPEVIETAKDACDPSRFTVVKLDAEKPHLEILHHLV